MSIVAYTVAEPFLPLAVELDAGLDFAEVFARLDGLRHVIALESSDRHPEYGRYSYIAGDPAHFITPDAEHSSFGPIATDFPTQTVPGLPPFQGGVAGLFGYGLAHAVERLPPPKFNELLIPDLAVGVYDWVISFDHVERRTWLVSTGYPERTPVRRARRADTRLRQVMRWLQADPQNRDDPPRTYFRDNRPLGHRYPLRGYHGVTSNFVRPAYLRAVQSAVDYIHAGDCFQVNLSHALVAPQQMAPLELYRRSRLRNPAPFAGYFDAGDFQIVSSSPERFLKVVGREVETRPIKGTRPRGTTAEESADNVRALVASPKDRAENVMIVDLLRNDLGRVCEYGSIRVPTVCAVETYRHVHHLTSVVRGRLREDRTALDLLKAAFPGGSVTGAPKVRAMEIIAELEPTARGAYCGSLGFVGFDGSMDTNILIRSFTVGRGWVRFPVGGGIVADSDPESEYAETLHKAEGMLRTLG